METYTVYCHVFPNGKRYVGITRQQLNRRWRRGSGYSQNIRMTNAIKHYGWENIEHQILAEGLTAKTAEDLERHLIQAWDLMNPANGYNYAEGGSHPSHSEETRKKIGKRSKGRTHSQEFKEWIRKRNSGSSNYMYGRHHTEETKQKIREAKIGKPGVNKGKFGSDHPSHKCVAMVDLDTGAVVKRFGSYIEAAEYIHRSKSGISEVTRGIRNSCGGYGWKHEG